MREEKFLPVWHFSDKPPWNTANRLSEFPYQNTIWCVIHPDGHKDVRKLQPMLPENQLIFKGDRVFILVGPDKGRVALVDPSNNEPCKCSWRYTEDGIRVRVSLQTGHVIPLPAAARYLDDLTDPKTAVVSSGDTNESFVSNITLNYIHSTSDVHFEKSLSQHLNLKCDYLKPAFTYWY
ncbi:putative 39S ribosomal protein L24, mitochondrial [Schistosoma japonicum]|nr:putative 39S ribosomal protein L24, mitochondrial [Schistosoma japonicum]